MAIGGAAASAGGATASSLTGAAGASRTVMSMLEGRR
jgi:hypothetical protein